jgi:hypothetical protein
MSLSADDRLPAGAPRIRHLDFPVEATTANGELITIEAIAPDDDDCFFLGFVWPLGRNKFGAFWSLTGRASGEDRGLDIDPASPDVRAILKDQAAHIPRGA